MKKFITISELSKMLNLIDPVTKKPSNHVIRYWEKEFKEIKPKIINNRRYYSSDQIEIIKMIKFLLKNKGLTISGVKNLIKFSTNELDDYDTHGLQNEYYRNKLKSKSKVILEKIKKLKFYGKKNSS